MKIGTLVTLIILFAVGSSFSQHPAQKEPPDIYYKHYTGVLDTNMQLTFDILSNDNKITGYYYYGFPIPGSKQFQYGKTLPVEGSILGSNFTISEKINPDSKFSGILSDSKSLNGKWQRKQYQKDIYFQLKEDYSGGSLPFKAYSFFASQKMENPYEKSQNLPEAKIDIMLLYPESEVSKRIKDSIDYLVTEFFLDSAMLLKSPELLMENIGFDFFNAYLKTTDGIEHIRSTASFNWKKSISSEVLYNDHYLLSVRLSKYAFTGGAHGISIHKNFVMDLVTGRRLTLSDFFIPGFESKLNAILDRKLRQMNGIFDKGSLRNSGFLVDRVAINDNFYINNDGIGFFYNVYEIAPYASGPTEIFIPFFELKNLLVQNNPFTWTLN